MGVFSALEPKHVFRYFEEICAIPHGSGDGQAIGDYCERFAAAHRLRCLRDAYGNVVIFKNGHPRKAPILLQGHLDMVCVCEPDVQIDFLRDGLPVATDGEYVFARGTSLGADDGIAVAMILALLDQNDADVPPIEAVFTMDEETSMRGASGLDVSCLTAKRMLNLDSEAEGTFWVSCAGGERVTITLPLQYARESAACLSLRLTGLAGGHSGTEIDKGRRNAVCCMAQLLQNCGAQLVSLSGGKVDNAIPAECEAVALADKDAVRSAFDTLYPQWVSAEPQIALTIGAAEPSVPLTKDSSRTVLALIDALPCGVQAWSRDIENFVETSLNLGVCTVESGSAALRYSVRSSVDASRQALVRRLTEIAAQFGASASASGAYPAWQYRKDSPLRETAARVWQDQFGVLPKIEAIHAGLECGVFAGKIDGLDCISMGPDILDIHSPLERLSVASTARTFAFVQSLLHAL